MKTMSDTSNNLIRLNDVIEIIQNMISAENRQIGKRETDIRVSGITLEDAIMIDANLIKLEMLNTILEKVSRINVKINLIDERK